MDTTEAPRTAGSALGARVFGTDGIRGRAGTHPITPAAFYALGRAFAAHLGAGATAPRVLIAQDGRWSGAGLEMALACGMQSVGAKVTLLGVVPTSAVAYLTAHLGFDGGAMVTASHNAASDNGVKFFSKTGMKLVSEDEGSIAAAAFIYTPETRVASSVEHRPVRNAVRRGGRRRAAVARSVRP